MQLSLQHLDSVVRLPIFAEQQGLTRSNRGIGRVFRQCFLAGLQRFRQILCGAVGIHDHHARATILFLAEMPQFFKGKNRRLIILGIAIKLAKLLIQNRQGPPTRRQSGRLPLDARHRIRQDADGVLVTPLRLVEHRFVVHHFQAARSVLPGLHEIFFGFIELMQLAVNLRDSQIDVRVVRHHIGKLLVNFQSFGEFFFGQQGLPQPALVA